MHSVMHQTLSGTGALKGMKRARATRAIFLDGADEVPAVGTVLSQKDLAWTPMRLAEVEKGAASRETGTSGTRQRFYRGDIAEEIARFMEKEGGWITRAEGATSPCLSLSLS